MSSIGPRSPDHASWGRGQASVLGVVLVVGITVLGTTGILIFGTQALDDARTQSEIDAAEQAMTQLDSQFSLTALGSADSQQAEVDLRSGATLRTDEDAGWMNVSAFNQSTDELETEVMNVSLGAVIYEHDGSTVAYQGGGVWKRADGGSVMVSPPEFHYRTAGGSDPTLTLPLVVVHGSGTIAGGSARVTNARTDAKYPLDGDPNKANPLTAGEINVTVQSDYYEAWGAFFEARTSGTVTYDHDHQRVTVSLVIPQSAHTVSGGIVSGASSTTLEFANKGSSDSYNSSIGPYSVSNDQNTSIIAAGDIDLANQATIEGNVVTGGSLTTGNNAEVTGNLTYGGSEPNDPSAIGGWIESGADVDPPKSVDWLITARIDEYRSSNDNDVAAIDDSTDRLQGCDSTCTLPAGTYYLDEIDLGTDDDLEIDTTGGDVEIVVDGDADFHGDSHVSMTPGDGTVRFYVDGSLAIENQANVSVPADESPRLWFYMRPGETASLSNNGRLVGVIYGPGTGVEAGTDIQMKNQITVLGGLVGSVDTVKNGMGIHFDESLNDEDPLAGYAQGEATITYMHVTVNRVDVSAAP